MKLLRAALALVLLVPLAGCWDRLEIEERAVVLAIAVDIAESHEAENESYIQEDALKENNNTPLPDGHLIRLTAQIAVPGRIPLGPGEGGGGGGASGGQEPVWVLESVGHTIEDAVEALQQEVADRLFFGHLRVIVISEDVARRGTSNINDYLRRNPEIRRLAWLVVSKENASEYLKAAPQLERVPALYLMATLDNAVQMGRYPMEPIGSFWIKLSSKGREANLPYLQIEDKDNVRLAGLAYFKNDKLAGVTKTLEIALYMGLIGNGQGGYSSYVRIPGTEETAMFRVTNRRASTDVHMRNGRPTIQVKVYLEGNISELSEPDAGKVASLDVIRLIENDLSERITKQYEDFIHQLQSEGADIFGYGEYIRAKAPGYWNRNIRTKERWQEAFKDLDVQVTATLQVRRVGQKAK
ncbi:Ger(x)C family spore germination protein [Paenibacillus sp.]|uniref:Ger(x)C family spore germination protein n=1 Tax=Paenibacillus sp. TaxID=58172 RepID=UPI002D3F6FD8|nr:Ger(x)C family spore germination protein [Paenibacillus sp.]HZG86078.1 Ger(x)C family spore germination protein [Paenibacillus sp.]